MNQAEKSRLVATHLLTGSALVFPESKLAVFFTPKAGASSLLNWYHHQSGLTKFQKDARTKFGAGSAELMVVRQSTSSYQAAIEDFRESLINGQSDNWTTVKFVRNPYLRAVSSFFMVMLLKDYKLSFREFVHLPSYYFKKYGVGHASPQVTDLERAGILKLDHVFKIEDGIEKGIGKVEALCGMKPSKGLYDAHANKRGYKQSSTGDIHPADIVYFSADVKSGVLLPPAASFLDEDTRAAIHRIYRQDFIHYGYDEELPHSRHSSTSANRGQSCRLEMSPRMRAVLVDEHTASLASLVGKIANDERLIVFGTGGTMLELLFETELNRKNIVAVSDDDVSLYNRFYSLFRYNLGLNFVEKRSLPTLEYDKVLIAAPDQDAAIENRLLALGIAPERILRTLPFRDFEPMTWPLLPAQSPHS